MTVRVLPALLTLLTLALVERERRLCRRPHQIDVDQQGNVYIASWDGGWVMKHAPKPSADRSKLVGRKLVLSR